MKKTIIFLSVFFVLSSCGTKDTCSEYCSDFLAINYTECETCRYTNATFYIKEPNLIEITIDSVITELDSIGNTIERDTSFTRMVPDTNNYFKVLQTDLPVTLNIDTLTFNLNSTFNIPLNACIDNIPNTGFIRLPNSGIISWLAISADSSRFFTGTVSADPNKECMIVEINKKP